MLACQPCFLFSDGSWCASRPWMLNQLPQVPFRSARVAGVASVRSQLGQGANEAEAEYIIRSISILLDFVSSYQLLFGIKDDWLSVITHALPSWGTNIPTLWLFCGIRSQPGAKGPLTHSDACVCQGVFCQQPVYTPCDVCLWWWRPPTNYNWYI